MHEPTSLQAMPQDPRARRARPWQSLIALSGFVLAATFFLPTIEACGSSHVPAEETYELINSGGKTYANPWPYYVSDLLICLGMFVSAYVFGALMAISALARLLQHQRAENVGSIAIAGFIIANCLIVISATMIDVTAGNLPSLVQIIRDIIDNFILFLAFFLVPMLVLIYLMFSIRLRRRAFVCHMFVGSLSASAWFAYWFIGGLIDGSARYGLYLSFSASIVLLISVIGEAKAISLQSWRTTIWQLLTCRLRECVWKGHCPACDYYLFGLTEMRCPECGRPFTFEELGTTPQELGYQSKCE